MEQVTHHRGFLLGELVLRGSYAAPLAGDPEIFGGMFAFLLGGLFGYALRSLVSFQRRHLYRRRGY
jgi:hypothetical protein